MSSVLKVAIILQVKVGMNVPIFNLETKKEELLAGAGVSWTYFQTIFPLPQVNKEGMSIVF